MRLLYEPLTEIPANFTEVEYLKSDGVDLMYITPDLSYFPDFEVGVKCDSNSDRNATLGVDGNNMLERSSASKPYWTLHASGTTFMSNVGVGTYADAKYKDGVFSVNGVTFGTKENTFQSGALYLFKPHSGNNNLYKMSIYFFKAWDSNGNLVRDFVPCLDNNNVPCMYDKVEGKAYYNQGTGTFIYGRKIIPAEYLESSGTQYIDTGLKPTDSWGYKLRNTYTVGSGEQCAIGVMDNGNRFVGIYTSGSENAISGAWGSFVGFLPNYPWTTGTVLEVKCNYKNDRKIIIDQTEMKDITDTHISGTISNTIYLFARHYGSTVTKMVGKIYGVEITDGNDVVGDFIPAKDENNVGFMFDKVRHTVYLNDGTGSFTVGRTLPKKKLRLIKDTKRRVPKGFKEVEYLESSGTQWIDVGTNINTATDEIEMYFQLTDTANYKWIFGEHDDNARLGLGTGDGANKRNVAYYNATTKVNDTEMYNSQHYYKVNSSGVYLNGTKIANYASFASTSTLYLFNLNLSSATYTCKGKVWAYRQKRNGVLIRDMIPCLDTNNVPCMYDVVNNKAYYNQGTGTFSYGHTITPVEYLQSNGQGAYIKTGITANFNTKAEVLFSYSDNNGSPAVLGGRTTSTSGAFCIWGKSSAGYVCCNFSNTGVFNSSVTASTNTKYTAILESSGYTVNGSKTNITTTTTFTSPELYMFDVQGANTSTSGTGNRKLVGKIYCCKIWDNGTLVRDFIPVKDENNVGYMFDKVTHTLYANAGTGSFVVGSEYKDITRFLEGE